MESKDSKLIGAKAISCNAAGKKVHSLRQRHSMTQKALADALGLASFSYLSEIEHSHKTPHPILIVKIADVFGVTADQLMRDDVEVE